MVSKLALFLSLAAALFAAKGPQKVFPYPYSQEDLPNGLRLITVPTDTPNVVATYIVVQTGSRNEVEAGKTGFAHLFEHVMFKGTEKFPTAKYEKVLQEIGASSNAFTSDDLTAYYNVFSKEDLDRVLEMEADRFQHLKYSPEVFKTETLAVLGEYNKNSANPSSKLFEALRDTAFSTHTYKHTTMGFLKDIQDMPNQYDYSLEFFKRYYRPEYTTIIVAGDVKPKEVRASVDKYWGEWKRGDYKAEIPAETEQKESRTVKVDWPTPTLPWLAIAYRTPAYGDTDKDVAALDAIRYLAFSDNSDLYQKLVLQDQTVDVLSASNAFHVDPYLFTITVRIKKPAAMDDVQEQVLKTVKSLRDDLVPAEKLATVLKRVRYQFAMGMDNTQAIAAGLTTYVALRRTPETLNKFFEVYEKLTPEDIRAAARKYFVDEHRTIATLSTKQKGSAQ